MTDARQKVLMW